ncbi:MAG: glycoside hydrolase family 95 protein, partial [Clostridia bacterium]|nr:glycoside hydrolase family 95 protein [Clostridia bacterium]
MNRYILHLENPGQNWENYSPIGNGSCGMMISGGVMKDILTLNEETIWSENAAGKALENLSEKIAHIRELFIEEKPFEATEWISEQIGEYPRIRSYEYAGRLLISLHEDDVCTEYSRDLDLQNGVCTVSYTKDGASYKREYFASMTNGLLCAKYTASTKFDAKIAYERENTICASYSGSGIKCIAETAEGGHKFALEVKVLTDGMCCVNSDALSVKDATYIETYTAISTAFKRGDYE